MNLIHHVAKIPGQYLLFFKKNKIFELENYFS